MPRRWPSSTCERARQKILMRGGSQAQYVPSGHLVYAAAGSLRAVAFDVERLEPIGTAFRWWHRS